MDLSTEVMLKVRTWESEGVYPERWWLEEMFGPGTGRVIDQLVESGRLVATDVFVTTPEVALAPDCCSSAFLRLRVARGYIA